MLGLVITGVLVHLLLLSAVFDIYFVSPILQGMTPHKASGVAPAKRLVLFVADGLRADSLYCSEIETLAPYLNSLTKNNGSWGISHTQVPTESRPGHVAMLAGFNEDPSAITRGWKSNPVEFDSVINQSSNAWCWGSPDIVDIFNKDNKSHIHLHSYSAYMQDFSGQKSPTLLDLWVFDQVQRFFKQQKKSECTDFCEDGNIFFLHLLGLDTAGHSFKPQSKRYIENIHVVNQGVSDIVNLFEKFFEDNQTAYIFTADHGMTNWGSHGDGSMHETEVPFIAWGAGITRNTTAQDIEQANIASLISSLIGINIPINSLGVVPLNYINTSVAQKAHIMYSNARQLSEQYISKHKNIKESTTEWIFQPFPKLSVDSLYLEMNEIRQLIKEQKYQQAITQSHELIDLFKDGLKYYCNYYQRVLLVFVTVGFIGWIVFLFISIDDLGTSAYFYSHISTLTHPIVRNMWNIKGGFVALFLMLCMVPFASSLPLKYYTYCLFPILTWSLVLNYYKQGLVSIYVMSRLTKKQLIHFALFYITGIDLLIFTFFKRFCVSILFVLLTFRELSQKNSKFTLWTFRQLILGLSTLLMDMQTEFSVINQILCVAFWLIYAYHVSFKISLQWDILVLQFQFGLLLLAFTNTFVVHFTIMHGQGLFLVNQLISWFILLTSLICPLFISNCLETKLLSAMVALMTPYTLMAVGYENMYMVLFSNHVLNWIQVVHERKKLEHPRTTPPLMLYKAQAHSYMNYTDRHSVEQCFYLLAFIMLSYFGVGNTASMNSFDPMWVRCFITVFSPFTMTGLILVKLIIPFLMVMCMFRGVIVVNQSQVRNTFLIIMLFCDLMVIQFLYFVKNEGSWLEIGISLSRFIVVNVTTIFLLLLYQIASFLTTQNITSWRVVSYLYSFMY